MKRKRIFGEMLLICIVLILLYYSCGSQNNRLPENIDEEQKQVLLSDNKSPALVVFYIGDCSILKNNTWESIRIGQFLSENDTIKVDKDSYLEIKLNDKALICIEENSEILIQSLYSELDKKIMKLYLKEGSVFNSLKKLLPDESYELVTPNVILSIRGTQFMVKESNEHTLVAVREGSVALLPPGIYEHSDIQMDK